MQQAGTRLSLSRSTVITVPGGNRPAAGRRSSTPSEQLRRRPRPTSKSFPANPEPPPPPPPPPSYTSLSRDILSRQSLDSFFCEPLFPQFSPSLRGKYRESWLPWLPVAIAAAAAVKDATAGAVSATLSGGRGRRKRGAGVALGEGVRKVGPRGTCTPR